MLDYNYSNDTCVIVNKRTDEFSAVLFASFLLADEQVVVILILNSLDLCRLLELMVCPL